MEGEIPFDAGFDIAAVIGFVDLGIELLHALEPRLVDMQHGALGGERFQRNARRERLVELLRRHVGHAHGDCRDVPALRRRPKMQRLANRHGRHAKLLPPAP
jgi:hypothetical protein